MKVKSEISPKYFILDVLPVEESLISQYDDIEKEEIINVEMFKYIDFDDHKLYSPRLQFVFDILDEKNVYLVRFDSFGYNINALESDFQYSLHFKIYPGSTRAALVTEDNIVITAPKIDKLPESFVDIHENVVFDDYIHLVIEGSKVINFSNQAFFKDIEKLFS